MPVDEDILNLTITSIAEKTNVNFIQNQNLRELYKCAKEIKLVEVPDPIPEDLQRTKKVMPIDDDLGTEITVERREQIYNKLISDVEKL